MNEQELNHKLAEWAGFRKLPHTTRLYYQPEVTSESRADVVPSFTQSLDACFKHFKSKFRSMACGSINEDKWKGAWAKVILHSGEDAWIREPDIEPALAICLAVEKLIGDKAFQGALQKRYMRFKEYNKIETK